MSDFSEEDAFAAAVPLSQRAMAGMGAPYLDGLNPAQRDAVETLDGPVLMLAGAGTGKTRALTARIAHLLRTGRARGNEILAVTFTNKAAREMKERVGGLLGEAAEGMPWLGTFHAICVKLLRRHAELIGQGDLHLKSNFTILDTDDQIRLLKQVIVAAGIDEKRWTGRLLAGIIDQWKNRAWGPDQIPVGEASAFDGKGVALYAAYQRRLLELNAVDFGDLLLHVVTIFQSHDDVLDQYRRWFRYILVDEYQDTNVAQYLWLRLLAGGHKNICCVGDDDQSIYGWRGAEVGNILRFETDFPGAKVIRLEQNYRSTAHILGAAAGVIEANKGRLGKTLWTESEGGEKVRLIGHWDGEEEARWIGEEIEALQHGTRGLDPVSLNGMAILVRASHQMRAFEDRFLTIGLPYRVIGGPRFYERLEIRDAMAYFRLAVSPPDDLAFERIVNTPRRGLGDKAQQTIQQEARTRGVSLLEGARALCKMGGIPGKGLKELRVLVASLGRWHYWVREHGNQDEISRHSVAAAELRPQVEELKIQIDARETERDEIKGSVSGNLNLLSELMRQKLKDLDEEIKDIKVVFLPLEADYNFHTLNAHMLQASHIELAETILDESGYTAFWQNDKTPEAPGRLENLKELVKALENFENLQGFLEHVSLIMDNESQDTEAKVSIMTLHAAKGLEFPAVFLPGWEDGLFPSQRSMDESGIKGLEEERRLAYVGITRAEEICTISFAGNRRVYGQWQSQLPSRFIDELPSEHVEVLTPSGLGGALPRSDLAENAAWADVYNSPGWQRMQSRAQSQPQSRSSGARMMIDATAVSSFTQGDRVFHTKFGYGAVIGVDADKLEIAFDKAGVKKVVAKFVVDAGSAGDVPF